MSCTASVLPALDGCAVNPVKGINNIYVAELSALKAIGTYADRVVSTTTIVLDAGATFKKLTGVKDWCNFKSEAVVSNGIPDGYKHTFEILNTSVLTYANKKLLDESNSIVLCVETNQGEFLFLGANYGLYKTKQSRDLNANNGQISITFESRDGIEEPYSDYLWSGAI